LFSIFPSQLDIAERIELTISYGLKIIIIFTIIGSIIKFNPFLIASSVIILLFSALPSIIKRTMEITLPVEVDLVLTLFLSAHFILGEVSNYYTKFWWFDLFLHMSSGIIIGLIGFIIIFFFLYMHKIETNPLLVSIFSVSFSVAAGAFWEIIEFLMDISFNFNMQKGNIDTMTDLIIDILGACVVGFWAYRYITRNEDGIIKVFVYKFIRFNVRFNNKIENRRKKNLVSK